MSKFRPDNHIVGKVYDLTQENMNALIADWEKLRSELNHWKMMAENGGVRGGIAKEALSSLDCEEKK